MFKQREWLIIVATVLGVWAQAGWVAAQIARDELPEVAQDVGVDPQFGAQLPLDLRFYNEQNHYVRLGDLFNDGKPVLLSFNYSKCPKLCSVQLQNLSASLQSIRLKPGRDFQIVIVSIDPNEQTVQARELKQTYLAQYGDLDTADGWHVLTGDRDSIKFLADTCGYAYKYIPHQKIFSHSAAFIFVSPEGKIVRYLNGLDGQLRFELDKALIEAGEGRVGSILDRVLYFSGCFVFDEHQGRYSLAVMNIMRWGAGLTVLALAIWLIPVWLRRSNRRGESDSESENETDPADAPRVERVRDQQVNE